MILEFLKAEEINQAMEAVQTRGNPIKLTILLEGEQDA